MSDIVTIKNKLPETFTSMKAKMNSNVSTAIEAMNKALLDMCSDEDTKAKDKLKATQDYLALYMRLESEIQREKESRETMKQRKLNTRIKEAQVAEIENTEEGGVRDIALSQSKFNPTMGSSFN
jgi:hypothetical protein